VRFLEQSPYAFAVIPEFNGEQTAMMNGGNNNKKEEWVRLCEQAAVEQDPEKLLSLCQTISRLLEEKEKTLKETRRYSTHS
jgi:hypothetical protein